jgi:type IV pilus assembly protein PilE
MTLPKPKQFSRRSGGFTLIELMIACVILAIIVAVALPSYNQQTQKARRSDARNALLDLAGREERYLSVSSSYTSVNANVGYGGVVWPQVVQPNQFYEVTVTVPDPAYTGLGPSFILTAVPAPGSPQASDTQCATFTVNQVGKQTAQTSANVDNTTLCWGL